MAGPAAWGPVQPGRSPRERRRPRTDLSPREVLLVEEAFHTRRCAWTRQWKCGFQRCAFEHTLETFAKADTGCWKRACGDGEAAGGGAEVRGVRRPRRGGPGALGCAQPPRVETVVRVSKTGKISKFCNFLAGSFTAVSKRNFAIKLAFDSIFETLQDVHTFAPLQIQHFRTFLISKFREISANLDISHFAKI